MPFVEKAMSRNRFDKIKSYMHFNDNSRIDNTDKALKIRPFRSNCYEAWTDTTVTSSCQALVGLALKPRLERGKYSLSSTSATKMAFWRIGDGFSNAKYF